MFIQRFWARVRKLTRARTVARLLRFWCFILVLTLALMPMRVTARLHTQQSNRVALIVHFGDRTLTRCVTFDEAELSGYDILARSGLAFTASFDVGPGAAICAIEDLGCPAESCLLCHAPLYWSYWKLSDGNWIYSQSGTSNTTVTNGDVEGWSWGDGSPPPVMNYEDICPPTPPTATLVPPTATPLPPTATPVPPTATPVPPTATPLPPPATATATPVPMPEAWFRLDANPIDAGACTYVRWDAMNAELAYFEGEEVPLSGSQEICPSTTRDMTLRVVNDAGEQSYVLTLGVSGALPTTTPTATLPPTTLPQPTATSQPLPTSSPTPAATPQPTSTPAPTATPAAKVTATQRASLTPTPLPSATPSASPTSTDSPTAAPSATLSATPTNFPTLTAAPTSASSSDTPGLSYLAFALLAGGLLIGLGWRAWQKK